MTDRHRVRPMQAHDIEPVLRIQASVYPAALLEGAALFLNRLQISPGTCQVAEGRSGLLGYLVAYPWLADRPPALDAPLDAVPHDADSWFVHDCAVLPAAQGLGVAQALLQGGLNHARRRGLRHTSLVALRPAVGYWERLGYQAVAAHAGLRAKLAQYGTGARYMVRALEKPRG
ncbi:GNAT family N-acetyltransferase [Bordetella petrii]|uniref:GNAT family N-acetyltransferase n=1 Tax=Bordetella petrii TaxID=94624 RepID=UPI001A96956B|nr:GNAT family N-acetyltransferase [Bordetella petrii]MBO1111259.1 GNAT family N-acetyltransferase [Bordetella petrii]